MTACLQCFWMFSQIGFASNRNLMSSFGKASEPFCTEISWAILIFFQFSKVGTWFPDFSDSRPDKMCFGARWRFWQFFMSNILPICLPDWKCSTNSRWCSTEVDRTYLPVNMALAPFHKHLRKNEISLKGVSGISGLFFNWIAYGIAYWFRLESLGPI